VLTLGLAPDTPLCRRRDRAHTARELVETTLAAGALAALPWGAGKWLGPRGRIVRTLADDAALREHPLFFLGDSAQRPAPWLEPRVFRDGARVLPGTDPLPMPGCEATIASYAARIDGDFARARPLASLLAALRSGRALEIVGRRASLAAALGAQLRYRAQLRITPREPAP
jgi:hypothetical protein